MPFLMAILQNMAAGALAGPILAALGRAAAPAPSRPSASDTNPTAALAARHARERAALAGRGR